MTKNVGCDRIREAYDAGIRDFGENRMQEFLDKKNRLPEDINWHFIGRLQTNKVKYWLEHLKQRPAMQSLLHSLDRKELADEIEKQAARLEVRSIACLLQVNSSGEKTKGGFDPADINAFMRGLSKPTPLRVLGLMTIGPLTDDRNTIDASFQRMTDLQRELRLKHPDRHWDILSMGMSSDFQTAIEKGANMIRIGSAVFGARKGSPHDQE